MARFQLTVLGADSTFGSPLCVECPHAAAGCCVAPPRYDWSDLARVVQHGGREWLLAQIARGHIVPQARGASVLRRKGRARADRHAPRLAKCVFHDGAVGCTIEASQRPATCNFYVCESVYEDGERAGQAVDVARAREVHDAIVAMLVHDDQRLDREIAARWPDEARFGPAFLDWLGVRWAELRPARGRELPPPRRQKPPIVRA